MSSNISPNIWALLDRPTVSDELARDPSAPPGKIAEKLYSKTAPESDTVGSTRAEEWEVSESDLDKAATKFASRPSELFLKIYVQTLRTLEKDPLIGLVSPPLMASMGVMPLSICSVIPDIVRHMADVIIHAEREVFLATNYWEASSAATTITDALKELSNRVGQRKGERVVVKIMYDRGNLKQVLENHTAVPLETYTAKEVKLPSPEEVPNLHIQVMNYHRPIVGTFHAKYMVVDRKIAILNSNNIQDRVNVEFMTHLEGPIVNSFYDVALLSWNNALEPPLPTLVSPPPPQTEFNFGDEHEFIRMKDLEKSKADARGYLREHQELANEDKPENKQATSEVNGVTNRSDLNLSSEAAEAERDLVPPPSKLSRMAAVTAHLNTILQPDTVGDEPDNDDTPEFRPHILHSKHEPVPMVLVNRKPRGTPGHSGVFTPQNQSWLAAMKYAKRKVFIQTPTFNAKPIVEATLEAVRRGVEVTIYADLGFNDAGEMLPMQGGTNEMVFSQMYKELNEEHKKNLKVYWYTGKDQTRPINASAKKRNCHVKIMTIDDEVGIQGNGNQDSQSWFHSQEINIMVDSPAIIKEWQSGLNANQNTFTHGQVEYDGVWRDREGNPLADASGGDKGPFASLKGIGGAIARVRGTGGF